MTAQWDRVENKTAVVIYGAGALTLLWFSSTIVGAVNNVPVVSAPPAVKALPMLPIAGGHPRLVGCTKTGHRRITACTPC